LRIGAMTRFAELEHSPEIARLLPVVPLTMRTLANARVRNVATIGGNLAHADPHLDLPPVWSALGAQVAITGRSGRRMIAVEDLFTGYYETILRQGELITALHVPVRRARRATYVKVTTRAAHDWPALGIAVALELEAGQVCEARLVLGAATSKPTRLKAAEAVLRGAALNEAALRRAGEAAVGEVEIETDNRGSAAYKRHLLQIYLGRAICAAAGEKI
jgi:carbon-monoxide dehydrogenase medium subunit